MLVTGPLDPPPSTQLVTVSNAVSNRLVSNSGVSKGTLLCAPNNLCIFVDQRLHSFHNTTTRRPFCRSFRGSLASLCWRLTPPSNRGYYSSI